MDLNNPCIKCHKKEGKHHKVFDIVLCKKCQELPKYTLICKTIAKTSYHLTEKDLTKISTWYEVQNPHYRRASNMKLCTITDVRKVARQKYKCIDKELDKICESLTEQKENKKNMHPENIKREIRQFELVNALQSKGLKLRPDSKLCYGYIEGTITDWTIDAIVERMCQVKYLFDYCKLSSYFSEAYKIQRSNYDTDSVFDIAEQLALKEHGPYPKFYPWMNN